MAPIIILWDLFRLGPPDWIRKVDRSLNSSSPSREGRGPGKDPVLRSSLRASMPGHEAGAPQAMAGRGAE